MIARLAEFCWRIRLASIAIIIISISAFSALYSAAPRLEQNFSSDQIRHHHDDIWAIEYNPNLPFYYWIPRLDGGRNTISTAEFLVNGQKFGLSNQYFWRDHFSKISGVKYWSYIRSKGLRNELGFASPHMIYFAMGNNEDPRATGKNYSFKADLEIAPDVKSSIITFVMIASALLLLAFHHKNLYYRLGKKIAHWPPLLKYKNHFAALSGVIFAGWLYLMLVAPNITHKFSPDEIYYSHDNAWLVAFKANLPEWRMIKQSNYINRVISGNDFLEDEKRFPGENIYCIQDYTKRDMESKCWHYIDKDIIYWRVNRDGKIQSSLAALKNSEIFSDPSTIFIQFRLPPHEDPRNSGKEYHVNAKPVLAKAISFITLFVIFILFLPLLLKNISDIKFFTRKFFVYSFGYFLFFMTIYASFYNGLFTTSALYDPDSYGYINLDLIRPIGTYFFFEFIKLFGNFDRIIVPVQYFMVLSSIGGLMWVTGKILRQQWLGFALLVLSTLEIIYLSNQANPWSDLVYLVLSESLFLSSLFLVISCFYLLLMAENNRHKLYAAFGLGLFLALNPLFRTIGMAFFVIIPLYIFWHIYQTRLWRESAKHALLIILPIFLLSYGQSAYQKSVFGQWGGNGGGAGYFLLAQTSAFLTPDRAQSINFPETEFGQDQKLLAQTLAKNTESYLAKLRASHWPYDYANIWENDPYGFYGIFHAPNEKIYGINHATLAVFQANHPKLIDTRKYAFAREKLMRSTAIAIITAYPFEFIKHVLALYLFTNIQIGNGGLADVNFLLPVTILAIFFTIMTVIRPHRTDFAALAITGLSIIAYIFAVCVMGTPLSRYVLIIQIPSTIVVFGGIFMIINYVNDLRTRRYTILR